MRGYAQRDGRIVLEQGGDSMQLSPLQVRVLMHLAARPGHTTAHHVELHQVLWPGQLTPLTAAQRAALSRSLRRMEEAGWVQRVSPTVLQLGEHGARLAVWLRGWGGWAEYQAAWLTDPSMQNVASG